MSSLNADFRARLCAREPLLGTFVKTPHPIVIEVLGHSGFDFAVIDAEHAPFDRASIDTMLIAARAVQLPLIVRVPSTGPDWVLNVLDSGAAGILVPHVNTAEQAAEVVAATRYVGGKRGFAGTTRAAGYSGRSLSEHLERSRSEVSVICQVEEPESVHNAAEIAAVEGVDALFVGRADLAVSSGERDFFADTVSAMCAQTLGQTQQAATGLYCAPTEDMTAWRQAGASLFVIGSEHGFIQTGGKALRQRFEAL